MIKFAFALLLLSFVSCVSTSPQHRLNFGANNALDRNDYVNAIKKYGHALSEARANSDRRYEAIAMYGLGRAYGYSCNFKEAENWFLKSIELRETIPIPDSGRSGFLSQNLLELARLYKSNGQYDKANSQFEKAIPLLESWDIERRDPIGYVNVLEDYAVTLENSGNTAKSEELKTQIKKLKKNYPNRRARFIPRQYPSDCQ